MEEFFDGVEFTNDQVAIIAKGLMDLAAVDGVDKRELLIIEKFYATTGGDPADLKGLKAGSFDIEAAKAALDTREAVDAFFMTALLLIYADRDFSAPEQRWLDETAAAFEVDETHLDALHFKVRARMLFALNDAFTRNAN